MSHTFFSKSVRNALVIPNRIVVKSLKTDEDQYSGEATSAVSYALLPITGEPIRTKLEDGTQAKSIAEAMITRLEMAAQRGAASVPMNLGSEFGDYVKVGDSRAGDSRVGNLGYIRRSYDGRSQDTKAAFSMDFSLGNIALRGVAGTRPSLLPEARVLPEPTLAEQVIKWGTLKPTLEDFVEAIESIRAWQWTFVHKYYNTFTDRLYFWQKDIEEMLKAIALALGWFEGQELTQSQIGSNLLPYYTKTQVKDFALAVVFVIDGGGEAITTGEKGHIRLPFAGEIQSVELFADQSGSIVIDIWKDTYANFPPAVADTITASAKPTLSPGQKYQDTTLTGWTKTFAEGDVLAFKVDSITTIQRVTLTLIVRRT